MAKNSAILYIGHDRDDHLMIREAFRELDVFNQLDCVPTGEEAFQYLKTKEPPFLILCDYKLPGMDGTELRKKIEDDEELRQKAIPFVFFSTTVSKKMVDEVYSMNVQGLFEKGSLFNEVKDLLKVIYNYWQACKHPNN